jgi:hypothetical protein
MTHDGRNAASRRSVLLPVGALMFALAACGVESVPEPSAASSHPCEFDGSTERVDRQPAGGALEVSGVRHEITEPGCEERVVFVFDSLPDGAEPGYQVSYRDGPFQGPEGEVEVGGEALLEVVLLDAHATDVMAAPEPAVGGVLVVDLVKPPEVAGGSLWLIGLEQERPFAVAVEQDPEPALIVTIGAPAGS